MERIANRCLLCALLGLTVVAGGCGWSSSQSKRQTMTGVSESGYPDGRPADSGSPALASQKRPEKAKAHEAK
jgi:hypothetical protein